MTGTQQKMKFIIIAITFCVILFTGIIFKQQFVLILPLFISLFIMAFQAEANRYAALAGGINSLIYGGAYIYIGLYASAASAVFFSFPIQVLTFLQWKKRPYEKTVLFKKMSNKMRIISSVVLLLVWILTFIAFRFMNYEYALFDSLTMILAFFTPVLTMLAYVEYSYLWILSAISDVFLKLQLALNDPSQTTYLIYSIYAFYCIILAFINVRKFYKIQQEMHNP